MSLEAAPQAAPDPFNPLFWLAETLWRYRFLFASIVFAGTVAAYLVATRLPDSFTATGLLEIDTASDTVVSERTATGFVPPETVTETEAQVMRSANVLSRVIARLGLADGPDSLSETITALQRDLAVRPTGRSFIVEVGYEARDPVEAARIVNAVMEEYLGVEVTAQRALAQEAVDLLSDRLDGLRREVDEREAAVQTFRRQGRVAEGAGTEFLAEEIARLNEELIRARSALASAAASSVQTERGIDNLPEVVNSRLIQDLRGQEAEQQRRVSELAALYRSSHPRLIQARGALATLRDTIALEARKIAESLDTSEAVEAGRVAVLEAEVEALRDQLNRQRDAEITLGRLERELEAAQRVYEAFLNRFNEVQGESGLERPDGRVIAEAVPPTEPSGPNRLILVAGGGVLSCGLALALVMTLAILDPLVRTTLDAQRQTGGAPVASVPPPPRIGRGPLANVLGRRRARVFADAVTQLRATLLLGADPRPRTVVFTAADEPVDQAVIAVALAQACAVSGDDVVVVDADFGAPGIHRRLSGANEFGLADALADRADLEATLQSDQDTPLLFIPAGRRGGPALYRAPAMGHALRLLAHNFERVVLALPPILAEPGAEPLLAEADAVVLVAVANVTRRRPLAEAAAVARASIPSGRLITVLVKPG